MFATKTSPIMRKTINFKGDLFMTTIIVNAIFVAMTLALAVGLGVMIYAKNLSASEKGEMGIRV